MTSGMKSGAKKKNGGQEEAAREGPPTAMYDAAMSRPRRRAPPSPMNTEAGLQLWGRNPTQAPHVASATSGATLSAGSWATEGSPSLSANRNRAPDAMAPMPAARPSRTALRVEA